MLHRFLFVAGMTVGVMTPLVWAAYVARPASHATQVPAVTTAKSIKPVKTARDVSMPARVPIQRTATKEVRTKRAATEDVTASIPPTSISLPPAKPASLPAHSEPSAPPRPAKHAALTPSLMKPAAPARPRRMTRRAEDRAIPAVVDRYNGAHIIIVCAALTVNEQLRAGCP